MCLPLLSPDMPLASLPLSPPLKLVSSYGSHYLYWIRRMTMKSDNGRQEVHCSLRANFHDSIDRLSRSAFQVQSRIYGVAVSRANDGESTAGWVVWWCLALLPLARVVYSLSSSIFSALIVWYAFASSALTIKTETRAVISSPDVSPADPES